MESIKLLISKKKKKLVEYYQSTISAIKGSEQNRRLVLNTIFSVSIKGGSFGASLLLLPSYIRFFGNEEVLGVWFTAVSILSWVLNFDLGIGNGLRNHLVTCFSKKDSESAKRYISSAYLIIGAFVLIVLCIGYLSFSFINWNKVFNVQVAVVSNAVLLKVARLLFIGIMIQFFLRLICSVLFALQMAALPSLLSLLSTILILIYVSLGNSGNISNDLLNLSLFNIVALNLPLLLASLITFSTKLKNCIPNFKYYNHKYALNIMTLGGAFFWLQIMFMIIMNTNEFLISWFVSPEKVVHFKIYNTIFNIIGGFFLIALTPVWSEVTEAFEKNRLIWLKKLYKRLIQLAYFGVAFEFILIFFLQGIVDVWLGANSIRIHNTYSLIFALAGAVLIWNSILSSMINGLGKLKIALLFLTLGAIINIPLAYLFSILTESWISIIFANVISMLPFCIVQSIWLKKFFKNY